MLVCVCLRVCRKWLPEPVWRTYGNAVGQGHHGGGWVEAQGTVCVSYAPVCECWDEFITKLKDLMRRAEGQ